MATDLDARFQSALAALGENRRWYQTGYGAHYPAVASAVHDVDPGAAASTKTALAQAIGLTDSLAYVTDVLAVLAFTGGRDATSLLGSVDAIAEALRPGTRMKGARRMAAAILALNEPPEAATAVALYEAWRREHRMMTTPDDMTLAAVSVAAGADIATATERSRFAMEQLATAGYRSHWDIARLLALKPVTSTLERFLWLAEQFRGKRRKPLTDRRASLAVAALADHPLHELPGVLNGRVATIRSRRRDPDPGTALELAALLTLGESIGNGTPGPSVFDGLLLTSLYTRAKRDAD